MALDRYQDGSLYQWLWSWILSRLLSNQGTSVNQGGNIAKVIGTVTMNSIAVNITKVKKM